MTTEELRQLAEQFGSVVILKNDKPSFVFLTFDKYKDLLKDEEKEVAVNHFSSQGSALEHIVDPEHVRRTQDLQHTRTGISFDSSNGLNLSKNEHVKVALAPEREIVEKLNREVMALKDEIRTKEEQEYY